MAPPVLRLTNTVARELATLHGSDQDARAFRARALMAPKPRDGVASERVVILNDCHLGAGRDPETGLIQPGDDFTAMQERQFTRFLEHESMLSGQNDHALTLCINGDFIDFLQTSIERPAMPYPDGFASDGAPKNTPANAIVQLNVIAEGHRDVFSALALHLLRGHHIDFIPGNHDRHLWNDHVWQGAISVAGRTLKGFTGILADEMRALGAGETVIALALDHLQRKPFAVYADKWVDHGDMGDQANRVQRPYKEAVDPTPLHREMSMALGDYGVRGGFNALEAHDPSLDAISDPKKVWFRALKHPKLALKLMWAFIAGAIKEGHEVSPGDDEAKRIGDLRALLDRFPIITEQLNALRSPEEQLTRAQVLEGLTAIEKKSARPFFSAFKKGTGFFRRLYTLVKEKVGGVLPSETREQVYLHRLLEAQKHFGVQAVVQGHTHVARDEYYVTEQEQTLRYVNSHTWMDKEGDWGRQLLTFGQDGRGVAVIERGVDTQGKEWSSLNLAKVVGEDGVLVNGDLFEDAEVTPPEKQRAQAQRIFAKNKSAKNKP